MSHFAVQVVPVKLEKHPHADTLSVVSVDGYTVCVRTADWTGKDTGVFIPPDSICSDNPVFDFLGDKKLIRAKKLRGIPSFGLLVPTPDGAKLGDDVAEILGVTHYEPPISSKFGQGEAERPPAGYIPVYDLENARKYNYIFNEGEAVNCIEKIHGQNFRAKYDPQTDRMYVGSRTEWKRYSENNVFWKSLEFTPAIEAFCRDNPDCVLFGESAGNVQKGYDYGIPKGETRVFIFDILKNGQWLDYAEARQLVDSYGAVWCPVVAESIPYNFEKVAEMAEGKSLVPGANHIREGIVVSPAKERTHIDVGRVKLKFVSIAYLERK